MARKAAIIQAEVRDAKARLLADDLLQATQALESELADEQAMNERRRALELGAGRLPGRLRSPLKKPYGRAYRDWRQRRRPGTPLRR